jgi:hypothetical protein
MCRFVPTLAGVPVNDTARKILFKDGPDAAVHRAWDIGLSDKVTVTWFCGDKILCEQSFTGRPLHEIVPVVRARGFTVCGNDYVRSDAMQKLWSTEKTTVDAMQALGLKPVVVERPC